MNDQTEEEESKEDFLYYYIEQIVRGHEVVNFESLIVT